MSRCASKMVLISYRMRKRPSAMQTKMALWGHDSPGGTPGARPTPVATRCVPSLLGRQKFGSITQIRRRPWRHCCRHRPTLRRLCESPPPPPPPPPPPSDTRRTPHADKAGVVKVARRLKSNKEGARGDAESSSWPGSRRQDARRRHPRRSGHGARGASVLGEDVAGVAAEVTSARQPRWRDG